MKSKVRGPLADSIDLYLAHKRSLGKQLVKVGQILFLLDDHLLKEDIAELSKIASSNVDGFVASRPRHSSRSYNGLLGALRGYLIGWWSTKCYRSRRCVVSPGELRHPGGHSSSIVSRPAFFLK
jgi:hypothetical protein